MDAQDRSDILKKKAKRIPGYIIYQVPGIFIQRLGRGRSSGRREGGRLHNEITAVVKRENAGRTTYVGTINTGGTPQSENKGEKAVHSGANLLLRPPPPLSLPALINTSKTQQG